GLFGGDLRLMSERRDHELDARFQVAGATREPGRHVQGVLVVAGDLHLTGVDQVVRHGAPLERNAFHRIDDVSVEAGKEAEAVFSGWPRSSALITRALKGLPSDEIGS